MRVMTYHMKVRPPLFRLNRARGGYGMLSVRALLEAPKVNNDELVALTKRVGELDSVVSSLQGRLAAAEARIAFLEAAPK